MFSLLLIFLLIFGAGDEIIAVATIILSLYYLLVVACHQSQYRVREPLLEYYKQDERKEGETSSKNKKFTGSS
jgi:hypothetical protein